MTPTPAFHIRHAQLDDAEQIVAHLRRIADEPDNGTGFSAGEADLITVEQQQETIKTALERDNVIALVAESADGQIIGQIDGRGARRRAGYGTVGLGITVHRDWRDRGVGTALMQGIIDWAWANPVVRRLELEVFSNNPRAIHLYEKLGFEHEGRRRRAFFKDGGWLDSLLMGMLLEKVDETADSS